MQISDSCHQWKQCKEPLDYLPKLSKIKSSEQLPDLSYMSYEVFGPES